MPVATLEESGDQTGKASVNSSSSKRSLPSGAIKRGRPVGNLKRFFARVPFAFPASHRHQRVIVRRPRRVKIDQSFARRQRFEIVTIAVANVDLLGIENRHRRKRRRDEGSGEASAVSGVQDAAPGGVGRRTSASELFVADESDEVSVRRPRDGFRKHAGEFRRRQVAQEHSFGRIEIDVKLLAGLVRRAVEHERPLAVGRTHGSDQRVVCVCAC